MREGLSVESFDFKNISKRMESFQYALIYMMSEVILQKVSQLDMSKLEWEECQEAYFFDKNSQLHLFCREGEWFQTLASKNAMSTSCVERRYGLSGRYKSMGKILVVDEYLDTDEDGQAYVAYTCLRDIQ